MEGQKVQSHSRNTAAQDDMLSSQLLSGFPPPTQKSREKTPEQDSYDMLRSAKKWNWQVRTRRESEGIARDEGSDATEAVQGPNEFVG